MQDYIKRLEAEFSLIEKGFKEEEKRAQADYASQSPDYIKQLSMLAYQSETYQVRMYAVFLMGYLSQQEDILNYLREQVCLDPNWAGSGSVGQGLGPLLQDHRLPSSLAGH